MTVLDILPPSGLKRFVEGWLDTVATGLRRLRRGGLHFNAPPPVARSLLTMLTTLLRYALLVLACNATVSPLRPCKAAARAGASAHRRGASFRLFPPFRLRYDDDPVGEVPQQFKSRDRDPVLWVQRRLDMLARVLANPRPLVMRMARRLPTQLMVMGPRPSKRPPSAALRETWAELRAASAEGWDQLHAFRRRTHDIVISGTSAS